MGQYVFVDDVRVYQYDSKDRLRTMFVGDLVRFQGKYLRVVPDMDCAECYFNNLHPYRCCSESRAHPLCDSFWRCDKKCVHFVEETFCNSPRIVGVNEVLLL